jgi:hemerythrin superfamily protein
MVVYPALRGDADAADADHLESEHGYIKTFIFELNEMGPAAPSWLQKVREFRQLVADHAHMEEEQVFPKFKKDMTAQENAHITSLVNRDGFWMA